ncbi:dihydrofolate reductase family protein [Arthrobacter sp. VKM Ac-2550]|uniref:dihydrofolate reductase family protein n=1 Tax=Crystallibacter permensis TaxID=1938888 RepID=UPI00222626DD|nr:dihydrofolate reductase family protein [Arthrobacter sp. VKM Ac-2550]MCW2134025.1 Dihydrofolate reductase [Arthrobacter sp. VKM Ac-2550]
MQSVSLDGFFEGLDRDISWQLVDDELHRHLNEQFRTMGAFMFGHVTHELLAAYWPTADQDPDLSAELVEFAGIWREMPKFVFSRTLTQASWNTTVIHDVVPEQISELKVQLRGDIALSGANLASTFMRHGLIDEFQIRVHPVVLGQGRPLFESPDSRLSLRLEETRAFGNGVVLLRYSRDDAQTSLGYSNTS